MRCVTEERVSVCVCESAAWGGDARRRVRCGLWDVGLIVLFLAMQERDLGHGVPH